MNVERALRHALGPGLLGGLDYYLRPGLRGGWGSCSGQERRRELVSALLAALPIEAVVESGTRRGHTTRFLAGHGVPVVSIERRRRYHAFATRFLAASPGVRLVLGDTRSVLPALAGEPGFPEEHVFFYLDARLGRDIPLLTELRTIFGHWRRSLALVPAFAVPGTEYVAHRGGPHTLDLAYLEPLASLGLQAFFPAAPPEQETGARLGCVVLCQDDAVAERLAALPELVRHEGPVG